jgi:hypothetical protein
MEIDEAPLVQESLFGKEVQAVYRETLGLIRITLVTHYGLEEEEAVELEKDLSHWFLRFCMRPGSGSPRGARPFLMVACCQFAHEYQKFAIGTGVRSAPEKLARLLDREPEDVARDFSRSLELLTYRTPDAG